MGTGDSPVSALEVTQGGNLQAGTKTSFRQGFAELFDVFPKPMRVQTLPASETTRLAFSRVGASLRYALGKASERSSKG